MEKKPALYKGKDEEGLRDQFIFVLETRYLSTTATGETFNRSGKTDILLNMPKMEVMYLWQNVNFGMGHRNFYQQFHNYLKDILLGETLTLLY